MVPAFATEQIGGQIVQGLVELAAFDILAGISLFFDIQAGNDKTRQVKQRVSLLQISWQCVLTQFAFEDLAQEPCSLCLGYDRRSFIWLERLGRLHLALFGQLLSQLAEGSEQFLFRQFSFQDVIRSPQVDGFPGEVEIVVMAEDQGLEQAVLGFQLPDDIQSVHDRHFDVRDQDVRLELVEKFNRVFAVDGLANNGKPIGFPVDGRFQTDPDDQFIICD